MRARVTRCREPISEHMSRATSVALRCQVVFSGFPEHLSVTGDLGSTLTLPGHLADVRLGCALTGLIRGKQAEVSELDHPGDIVRLAPTTHASSRESWESFVTWVPVMTRFVTGFGHRRTRGSSAAGKSTNCKGPLLSGWGAPHLDRTPNALKLQARIIDRYN